MEGLSDTGSIPVYSTEENSRNTWVSLLKSMVCGYYFQMQEKPARIKNRIARWFSIYFPEYKDVYGDLKAVSGFVAKLKDLTK